MGREHGVKRMCNFGLALVMAGALVTGLPTAADAASIAVVNVQQILEESSAGRIARDLLKQNTQRARQKIEGLKQKLDELQSRYESQKAVLKPKARAELEQEIMEKQMTLRQELQKTQQDLQQRDAELTSAILEELKPIIEKIADEKGIDIVLEKGEAGILLAPDKLDLTDLILRRYDASKSKGSSADD